MTTSIRLFLGIAAFLVVLTVIYALTSSDDTGSIALLASGAMAAFIGTYLQRTHRLAVPAEPTAADQGTDDDVGGGAPDYLPHASVWPWWMGVGALFLGLGLVFGLWALIPGALLMGRGVLGVAAESRHRL